MKKSIFLSLQVFFIIFLLIAFTAPAFSQIKRPLQRTLTSSALADLSVSFSRCPAQALPGQVMDNFLIMVKNSGKTGTGIFYVTLVLAKSGTGMTSIRDFTAMTATPHPLMWKAQINALSAGSSVAVKFPQPIKIPDSCLGSYSLHVAADSANQIKETNEENNTASSRLNIWVKIEDAAQMYDDDPPPLRLQILGKGFENSTQKSNIKVRLGSWDVTQTGGNSTVIYGYPPQDIPAGKSYPCSILDLQNQTVSNTMNVMWYCVMKSASPPSSAPREKVELSGYNFGVSQGTKKVYFSPQSSPSSWVKKNEARILFWSNLLLRVEVPNLKEGHYFIHIVENGKKVSGARLIAFDILK